MCTFAYRFFNFCTFALTEMLGCSQKVHQWQSWSALSCNKQSGRCAHVISVLLHICAHFTHLPNYTSVHVYTCLAHVVQIRACMTWNLHRVNNFARKIIGTYFLKIVHFHEIISSHLKAGLFWSGSSGWMAERSRLPSKPSRVSITFAISRTSIFPEPSAS